METLESNNQISPEINEKVKKNLIWIFIFAIVMIFAGLTSGYIVSQGGSFWVTIKMPTAFNISTVLILASSAFLILAKWAVKNGKNSFMKLSLTLAFVLGGLFGYFQYVGWTQLVEKGSAVSSGILNSRGKYGKYFTLIYQGKEITYDNATFYLKGDKVSDDLLNEMKLFSEALMTGAKSQDHTYKLSEYGSKFTLRYNDNLLTFINNKLKSNGSHISEIQHNRLWFFAENIVTGRGDFIMKGKYGEDFEIFYGGEALEYTNRTFYLEGQQLSAQKLDKLNTQGNTASSYIYAFTFVHLLHWLGGIIALLVMAIKGLQLRYTSENHLGIKLGSIYWHFLGILWLYLYAFLIFIH